MARRAAASTPPSFGASALLRSSCPPASEIDAGLARCTRSYSFVRIEEKQAALSGVLQLLEATSADREEGNEKAD